MSAWPPAGGSVINEVRTSRERSADAHPEIQARWKKQDRDGTKREEYSPSNFLITARPKGMTLDESVQLLYALVLAYQQDVKNEQLGALKFMGEVSRYKP